MLFKKNSCEELKEENTNNIIVLDSLYFRLNRNNQKILERKVLWKANY